MAITEIKYGSLASSKELNDNFNALNKDIQDLATNLSTTNANMAMSMSTLNNNMSNQLNELEKNLKSDINSKIDEANKNIASGLGVNGLYITQYRNGTSWYREYFSDAEKKNRVWLEQGFLTPTEGWGVNNCKTYNLVKAFYENNYTVVAVSTTEAVGSGVSSGDIAVEWTSTTQIGIGNSSQNTFGCRVYACGY